MMQHAIITFVVTALLTVIISAIVSWGYSAIAHGSGVIDWETSIRFGIIFGIVFTWLSVKQRKHEHKHRHGSS